MITRYYKTSYGDTIFKGDLYIHHPEIVYHKKNIWSKHMDGRWIKLVCSPHKPFNKDESMYEISYEEAFIEIL